MKAILFRNWFSMVLSFVSSFGSPPIVKEVIPQHPPVAVVAQVPHKTHIIKPIPQRPPQETAPLRNNVRNYTYIFTGQAIREGQPCSNAWVEVRVTSHYGAKMKNITTDSTGRYRVSIPATGEPNESINWEIHALTSDYKKVDLEGHQILTGNSSVLMEAPLPFVES